jgi:hypothetical protein
MGDGLHIWRVVSNTLDKKGLGLRTHNCIENKGKGEFRPRTVHEGPRGEGARGIALLLL